MPITPFQPNIAIDRTSDVPLYSQIAEALAALILDGTLAPGTRIEDEVSMARRLEVSRPTTRQALQRLVDRGLISRRRGAGTVVTSPHVRRPMELSSLLADLTKSGHTVSTSITEYSMHPADEEEAEHLGVEPGTSVTRIRRVRCADGEPIALMENLLPTAIAPSHDDLEHDGLYNLLRAQGVVPMTAAQSIGARNATTVEAKALDEKRRAALLTVTRTAYDSLGAVIEYGTHVYRASRYSFETTLFNA